MQPSLFTSESVAPGHPDKICDQISDAILDAHLAHDPTARVAVETAIKDQNVFILGEVTSSALVDYETIARGVLRQIGHTDNLWEMAADDFKVTVLIGQQSPNIAAGVDSTAEIGAGDQGMMYGYATDESPSYLPLALHLSHALMQRQHALALTPDPVLGPDAKAQVTIKTNAFGHRSVDTVVISTQHSQQISLEELAAYVKLHVIDKVIHPSLITDETKILINPAGYFHLGGSIADAGLTGRKIIVDTYGGGAPHGGGAFSGKDPTKVDRSAAYAARQLAREIVSRRLAARCTVRLAYAIGKAEPVELSVDTHGTYRGRDERELHEAVAALAPHFTPRAIIERMGLRRPIYAASAAFGHFGRDQFPWEQSWRSAVLPQPWVDPDSVQTAPVAETNEA